jgi:DNA-binding beta-propeller fold protein YncE
MRAQAGKRCKDGRDRCGSRGRIGGVLDRRELLQRGLVAAAPAMLGAPLALPAWARAASGAALVTADTEAHVAVVSPARGRVVRRIATVEDPRSIHSGPGGRVLVGHAGTGAVSLLEGRPLRLRRVLRGFATPRYAAFAPRAPLAYVSDSGHGEVAVIDLRAGRVVRRVATGAGARHLALSPDGRWLWVALGSSAAEIAVLDVREPGRPRAARRIRVPFLVHDLGFTPSGRRVWVTAGRVPRIAVYSAGTRRHLRTLAADAAPQHVSFGPDVAYVASGDAGTVVVHALTDGHVRRRTRVPRGSYNVQRTGARVLTPSLGTGALTVLDARGAVTSSIHVAAAAHDACLV